MPFFTLTYSQWALTLPSCLWSLTIFPSLPGSRPVIGVVANPARGHNEVPRSMGHIMATTRYSEDQEGSKSRQKVCDSTSNDTDQYQNGSSNLRTPYREQPRSTRIVVDYPRPAFSETKLTNYAPTSFDQQVQVSQGQTSYKNQGN